MRCSVSSVERVARAICEQAFYERNNFAPTQHTVDRDWRGFAQQAAAAIEAINGDEEALAGRRAVRDNWDRLLFTP
ncbi:hypothetical protein [Sphingomonas cavernae]|uniref:Uncharacterized protein n=1 Tax=Sphingomonas cavernae TaxID=2320861 RepID=A0A418WNR5_9SPHN|nr:hypothetical protein [Sphingomonas cavernae]RJF92871.1 hypothetical protein D3876_00305 [Sphingomonas cavernae]